MPSKRSEGIGASKPVRQTDFQLLRCTHFLFPSGFDEDAGQPTIKQGAASAYARRRNVEGMQSGLVDLVRHGLVKANYITNREQRELREITRYRREIIEERPLELKPNSGCVGRL